MSENLNNLDFCVAEVISAVNSDTYQFKEINGNDIGNYYKSFTVHARIDGYINRPIIEAKPANVHFKKIPIIGESILVFKLKSNLPVSDTFNPNQWYYISTVDFNSSINNNVLPGYTNPDTPNEKKIGTEFKQKSIYTLQPYEGDYLFEGRWGQSLRFSSTLSRSNTSFYTSKQHDIIKGDRVGDPIIILSNGHSTTTNFGNENINDDHSSIWLTSTQTLPTFKLNNDILSKKTINTYNSSQLIGTADRIILKSKNDDIILDSKNSIELNSKQKIYINTNGKVGEPLLHSTAVNELLKIIIRTLRIGFIDGQGMMSKAINQEIHSAETSRLLTKTLNRNIVTNKYKG